jgi:hypothetical protein
MQNFIRRPSIDLFPGIKVTKDTVLTFKNDNVEQKIENLVLRSKAVVKGEGYESVVKSTIFLSEGDILLFEENDRGYIKPMSGFCTIEEAANDLESIKDLG